MENQNSESDQKSKQRYVPPPARVGSYENKFAKFLQNNSKEQFSQNKTGQKTINTQWGRRDGRFRYIDTELEDNLFNEHIQQLQQETNFEAYDEEVDISDPKQQEVEAITMFEECQVHPQLLNNISRLKYGKPTAVQRYTIPLMLLRRDIMACAQTGSGKTAAYLFPIIAKMLADGPPQNNPNNLKGRIGYPVSLILAPTRELSIQIYQESIKFAADTGIRSVVIYGGSDPKLQAKDLNIGVDILVATPGRLIDFLQRNRISLEQVKYVVVDEADRMLDMGFEPQIRNILTNHGLPIEREMMMCSATFPKDIQLLAGDFLQDYIFLSIGRVGSTTELITQEFLQVEDDQKKMELHNHLQNIQGLALIFVETKRSCEMVEDFLERQGYACACIHGDKSQPERIMALNNFKSGKTSLLVATDVAARGLDIPRVRNVINYDAPNNIEDYIHRIGRTGRCGKEGVSLTFLNEKNRPLIKPLYSLLIECNQNIPRWLEIMYNQAINQQKSTYFKNKKFTDYRKQNNVFVQKKNISKNNQRDSW